MANLAIHYSDLGRKQAAMELGEKVLEARQKTLGSDHPDSLNATYSLALSYSDLGRKHEAMALGKKVLEARQRILGSDHPDTLLAQTAFAYFTRKNIETVSTSRESLLFDGDSQSSNEFGRQGECKMWRVVSDLHTRS